MSNFDRRAILVGSGVAVGVGATLAVARSGDSGRSSVHSFMNDPDSNYGDKPWKPHPNQNNISPFSPKMVCVLHINILSDFKVNVARYHFEAKPNASGIRDLQANKLDIKNIINLFNEGKKGTEFPKGGYYFEGMKNLVFGHSHHFIIYIKNPGIEFGDYPLMFGEKLLESIEDVVHGGYFTGDSDDNRSYHNISYPDFQIEDLKDPITGKATVVSKKALYVENHFQLRTWTGAYREIRDDEYELYSVNINVKFPSFNVSTGQKDMDIPIVIDPDTGNMGGGNPLYKMMFSKKNKI